MPLLARPAGDIGYSLTSQTVAPIATNGLNRSSFGMNDKNLNDDASLESQQLLVESSLPLVFETYDDAVKQGETDPIVLLVDCEDELGSQIANGWLDEETVNDAIAFQLAEKTESDEAADGETSQTTVFARGIAWKACRAELAEAFPYLAEVLDAGATSRRCARDRRNGRRSVSVDGTVHGSLTASVSSTVANRATVRHWLHSDPALRSSEEAARRCSDKGSPGAVPCRSAGDPVRADRPLVIQGQ